MNDTLRLGLTGGAACGKSTVAQAFAQREVPVIDADNLVHEMTEPGSSLLETVIAQAGPSFQRADGSLDRAQLRARMFRDAALRHAIEGVLHPPVKQSIFDWFEEQVGALAIAVVPLLFEADWHNEMDRVLVVNCPASVQRERLLLREGISPEVADAMLACQVSEAERLRLADDVLDTTDTREQMSRKIAELHEMYLRL